MPLTTDKTNKLIIPYDLSSVNLEQFYADLGLILGKKPAEMNLDCSQLQRPTSTHINILWDARYSCQEAGTQLRLISVSDGLQRVLKVLDLYDLFVRNEDKKLESSGRIVIPVIDPSNDVVELEFESTSNGISKAIRQFKEFLGNLNLQELSILEIETIFYEVATNIRLHAQINKTALIRMKATLLADKIVLTFIYPGIMFDPTVRIKDYDPGAVIKQRQKRGYGLIMINRLTDSLSYKRTDKNLNELKIEKYWDGSND